jgi:hypothetical protein
VSRRLVRCIALSCLLAPVAALAPASGYASTLDEAARLIGEHRAADAYRLLAAEELRLAGQPSYDYLFGVAALDSGRHAEAIAAFQRVLAQDSAAVSARLELGRAYFEAGDQAAARRQFAAIVTGDPPPAIAATAEAYLRAIDPPAARATGWSGGYEFGSGYDSNANAATDHSTFLGLTLDPENVETSSAYGHLAGWVDLAQPVGERSLFAAQARVGQRWNPNADFVDQTIASLDLSLRIGGGPTVFSIGAGGYQGWLDGEAHRWGASVDLALSHSFGEGWRATGLLRAGELRYDDDFPGLSVLDVDQQLLALSLQHGDADRNFGVTLYGANEDPRESGSSFGNDRLGVMAYTGAAVRGGHGVYLEVGMQSVEYDDSPGFFFGTDRSDQSLSVALGGELRDWPAAGFQLRPRIAWTANDSNIPLYEYDRLEIGLTLRRSFR